MKGVNYELHQAMFLRRIDRAWKSDLTPWAFFLVGFVALYAVFNW